jgi:Flp pilus assembly pilin Flp
MASGCVPQSAQGCLLEAPEDDSPQERNMSQAIYRLWSEEQGQDIAEYAVMLAVILVIVVGTIRLIGSNANTVFSQVASSIQ